MHTAGAYQRSTWNQEGKTSSSYKVSLNPLLTKHIHRAGGGAGYLKDPDMLL